MKKYIYMSMMAAALLTGCAGEEDNLFDASAAERLNAASDKYSALLESSPGGWVLQYYPTNDGAPYTGVGYLWCVKFNKDHSVLVGMNNTFSGNTYKEETSGWDVITDNGPVLSFNTANSLLHAFSDPDVHSIPGSSDDVWGVGVGGDYEFVIVDAPEDHSYIMLKGKKRATYNLMLPLEEGADFKQYLADVDSFTAKYFPTRVINPVHITMGDTTFVMSDVASKIASWYPLGGDEITETSTHPLLLYKHQNRYYVRFRENLSFEGDDSQYKEFVYNAETDQFDGTDGVSASIKGINANQFFDEWITDGGHKWSILRGKNHSEDISATIETLASDLAAMPSKYSLNTMQLRWTTRDKEDGSKEEICVLDVGISYTTKRMGKTVTVNANLLYQYDYSATDQGITLKYLQPVDTGASNILTAVPSLQVLLDSLTGSFSVQGETTALVLNSVRLAKEGGSAIIMQYER